MRQNLKTLLVGTALLVNACSPNSETGTVPEARKVDLENCQVELVVLGVGQDAGAPQIGNPDDPAWTDPSKRLYATSLGLIDHKNAKRYLFEATPDIREQMQIMDEILPYDGEGPYIDGIFLTHAHIGHYAGLMFLGRESMGAKGVPVYVMPRMKEFLETNGPWSQLVEFGNIELIGFQVAQIETADGKNEFLTLPLNVAKNISIGVIPVAHRDEYSETVIHLIMNKITNSKAFFVPDIDEWQSMDWLKSDKNTEIAFLDATFYDDNELPGRDMSEIPHPRVTETMDLIDASGDASLKDKIRFIHINHTNPLRDKTSDAYQEMTRRGYKLAFRGERFCL